MAALQRAVAVIQVDGIALAVGQHLNLDVTRLLEELLHVHGAVAEGRVGLGAGHGDRGDQVGFGVHHAHATSAAAGGGLDDHRVADAPGGGQQLAFIVAQRPVGAWHRGHAGLLHRFDGADLVAHQANGLGARADEGEAGTLDLLGEVGILGEEAVAGVDGAGVGHLGRADQRGDIEVGLGRGSGADAHRLIGEPHVHQFAVGLGVDRNRLDPELLAGPQDAKSDLAAVGDKNLVQHGGVRRK